MTTLLEIRDIAKRFGSIVALDGVSAEVQAGSITSVIGPNGSGKTTLMNVITGFYRCDHGSVRLGGTEFTGLTPQRIARLGIARTFQHVRLFEELSVFDNVLVAAERRRLRDARKLAEAALQLVGLGTTAHGSAAGVAYGHRRRVEIARALATGPKLLILDEPAAGMNGFEKGELREVLEAIRRSGVAILLVEHDMDLVMGISDRILALNFGRIIAAGPADAVRRDATVIAAYLGRSDD